MPKPYALFLNRLQYDKVLPLEDGERLILSNDLGQSLHQLEKYDPSSNLWSISSTTKGG